MESFNDFRESGTFTVADDIEVQGDLILKGRSTTLNLFAKDSFSTNTQENYILGILHDRTKVSLINCLTTMGPGRGWFGGEGYHHSTVFPHFIIFGEEHITPSDKKITDVSFTVDDANSLFHDFDAFGRVSNAKPHMANIIEEQSLKFGRSIPLGDEPELFYFTGKYEIFKSETVLGIVTATHNPHVTMAGPHGIKLDNKIKVNISFKESETINATINAVHALLRFLEVIAGRPQTVQSLNFVIPGQENLPRFLNVYWSMAPSPDRDYTKGSPHPSDLLIQAAITPEYFASVLAAWLDRDLNHEWRSARARFSTAFALQHRFTIDRLVGAANMFDILPASAVPADVQLTKELKEAKTKSRELSRALAPSDERQSILNALGRLGKASLKNKVRARANLITARIPNGFTDLEMVISAAVDCRNYFVHGTKTKMNYVEEFNQVIFFTEALEFIFAASDLIECGWNIKVWYDQGSALTHPFDQFRFNYGHSLNDLRRSLNATCTGPCNT